MTVDEQESRSEPHITHLVFLLLVIQSFSSFLLPSLTRLLLACLTINKQTKQTNSGGGFIPARILRTALKIPILAVSLELYDDDTNSIHADGKVKRLQWFDDTQWPGNLVPQGNVLIIDEVDDTRTTLQYCVEQVLQHHRPAHLAVAVVHNKVKPKRGTLPAQVQYFAGQDVPDHWNCYPWDAAAYGRGIHEHEALAQTCIAGNNNDEDEEEKKA